MDMRSAGRVLAMTILCVLGSVIAQAAELRIDNVTVVSPEQASPRRNVSVRIKDERIVSMTQGRAVKAAPTVRIIDGTGLYLSPGLIDSHVHLGDVPGMLPEQMQAHPEIVTAALKQIPRSYLYFGFTGLIDLISTPEKMRQWRENELRPDTYFCGSAPVQDGYPTAWAPKPQRYENQPYMIIQRGNEASAPPGIDPAKHTPTAVVTQMKADGASCVKTFFESGFGPQKNTLPTPRPDTLRELIDAAHASGLPVFMHANSFVAQEAAVAAGVDVIAHGLWHADEATADLSPAIKQMLEGVIKANIGWQPTLQVLYGELDTFDPTYLANPKLSRVLPASVIEWYRTPDGQTFHNNMASGLFPGAGLTPAQIFKAATLSNAEVLGLQREVGSVQAGRIANLLLSRKNPAETVGAYDEIVTVILRGRVLDRAELQANR